MMSGRFTCDKCNHCGFCCREWDIELSKEDIRSLVGLGYDHREFLVPGPVPKMKLRGRSKDCFFLDDETMCTLEKLHGYEAKPHTCKLYPDVRIEKINEKDYFFYDYGGKTFSRDVMMEILDKLKKIKIPFLFEMLLDEMEILRKQKDKYVDVFNYDDSVKPSDIRKMLARRSAKKLAACKFREDDLEEFRKINNKKTDVRRMINRIQEKIPTNEALNPNLPEMLLAFFCLLSENEEKDGGKLADYFVRWNAKRF